MTEPPHARPPDDSAPDDSVPDDSVPSDSDASAPDGPARDEAASEASAADETAPESSAPNVVYRGGADPDRDSGVEDSSAGDSSVDDSTADDSVVDDQEPDASVDDPPIDASTVEDLDEDPAIDDSTDDDSPIGDPLLDDSIDVASPLLDAPLLDAPLVEGTLTASGAERRLAAILFADVAGYTALSSHDEDLALSLIKSFQRVSKKIVGDKGGRVVKFLGDGMLAEFSSLDAAVNAAHALQNSFPYLDEVKESRVSLRVGVHLGDIVFGEDGDVYGSGVNVASRIEGHAPLAGVVVSDSAYQQLRHRRHYQFSSIGEKDLKGVPDPMELYVVLLADQEPQETTETAQRSKKPARRRSKAPWIGVGLALAAGIAAVALDLGGVQARADQILQDMGFAGIFTPAVFAEAPGYRAVEGGAAVNGDITVGFSGLINPATATSTSVQLLGPDGELVPTEVSASVDALAVEITPLAPLAHETRYQVVLTSELRASSGEEIRPPRGDGSPDELLSFITQPIPPDPPVVASTEPADGATVANGGGPVLATFSKPMNPLTMDAETVMLISESGARVATGLTCCGDNEGTLRVDPVEPLSAGAYRLVLGDGITDAAGLPMAPDTFGFRVRARPRPAAPSGPGRLTIQVRPASVASRTIVVIDGERVGPPPIENRTLSEGVAHRIEIFGTSEFSPQTIRIYDSSQTLSPAQELRLTAEVTPFGTISIDSRPGGRVFMDGEEIGSTALVTYPVTAGPVHTLEIRPLDEDAETYAPYLADFRVELLEDKSLGRVELPVR